MMQRISTIPFKNHIKWKISGHDGYQKYSYKKVKEQNRTNSDWIRCESIGFDTNIQRV